MRPATVKVVVLGRREAGRQAEREKIPGRLRLDTNPVGGRLRAWQLGRQGYAIRCNFKKFFDTSKQLPGHSAIESSQEIWAEGSTLKSTSA
jgi:hypothetical protein